MTDPLETFRRAAKNLKTGLDAGDRTARMRIAQNPPRAGEDPKLADALHVIARENNFATWPAMKEAVEAMGLDRAAKVQRLKIALHQGQTGVVQRLMDASPDLADGHFGLLCALCDVKAVWAMLSDDPSRGTTLAGPVLPLIHLCRSRMFSVWSERVLDGIAIADMLVANGADVNHAPDGLSPLYWALGHAGNVDLARWLLESGANPNDNESLYHATELGHVGGVKLLLSHGAGPRGTNALLRAMDFDPADMVKMLLVDGADPNEGCDGWVHQNGARHGIPALHHAARRMNSGTIIDVLLEHGADPAATWQRHNAYAFARVFGNADLVARIEVREMTGPLSDLETMLATCATGVAPGGYIDPAKLPDAYRDILTEILPLPNKLPHLKALVAIGLEWDRQDAMGVTPVQMAGWFGLVDVMEYFLSLQPDLGHVNKHGGTLLGTILHGSENTRKRAEADHLTCLQRVLEHGVALPKRAIEMAGNEDMRALMSQWAKDKPGQVVEYDAN